MGDQITGAREEEEEEEEVTRGGSKRDEKSLRKTKSE